MANNSISSKHMQIDKANARTAAFVAVAAFITVFSIISSRALLSQRSYQARVIAEKTKALKQLQANNEAAGRLSTSYSAFIAEPNNIIGGNTSGSGDRDGDNAKIILDALPSKYDFPAMVTSLEKLLSNPAYKINSITGTDDEINQQQANDTQPVEMPFELSVSGNFASIQELIGALQRSIRPISITGIDLSGSDSNLTASIKAKTFYQPEKTLGITTKDVK